MIEDSAIAVIEASGPRRRECGGEGEIVRLILDVFGEPVDVVIGVKDERVRLADIVPLAREVSTKITDKVNEMVRFKGAGIPCGKGCSACCNYLVPLAIPEVFRLREEVFALPLVRQLLIEQGCLSAARLILGEQPPALFGKPASSGAADSAAELLNTASNWYADFKLTCPFLYKHTCTIYEERPLACREYWVTGSSGACSGGGGEPEGVCLPVRMSEVLGRLASKLEGRDVEGLIMPLALVWADENPQRDERTWPAPLMVERFIEIIREAVPKSRVEIPACVRGKLTETAGKMPATQS